MFEEFQGKCERLYYCADIRADCKDRLKRADLSLVDRAFYYFTLNRLSYNGHGSFCKNTALRRGMGKSVADFLSCIDRLAEVHRRLQRVIVTNQDGIGLISQYSRPDAFIYCDPPYEQSTRTAARYPCDMSPKEHIRFLDACIQSESKILISGYDCGVYDVLTAHNFTKEQIEVHTTSGNKKPKTKIETLWKNY